MKLSEIHGLNWRGDRRQLEGIEFSSIAFDSRRVLPGSLFVAIEGQTADGHLYVNDAIDRGASVVLVQKDQEEWETSRIPVLQVSDTRLALGEAASLFYGNPSSSLKVFGVTGTNGKTTTSFMIQEIAKQYGKSYGALGTIKYDLVDKQVPASRTTPDSLSLVGLMAEILKVKGDGVVLEVSSHALDQQRVHPIEFDGVVFTNLSQDHLDYHGDMENYFQAKRKLFFQVLRRSKKEKKWSVINIDDLYGRRLFEELPGHKVSFGFSQYAQFRAVDISMDIDGSRFLLKTPKKSYPMHLSLPGAHNILNFLGAVACQSEVIEDFDFLNGRFDLSVPGRMQRFVSSKGAPIFIDYAHTEDALKKVLLTLKPFVKGKLILVFGCGGERDRGKRPKMGKVASEYADRVILTNDNPRSESPMNIVREIQKGFIRKAVPVETQLDREQAILKALKFAQPEDVILIAGKGHESEQILAEEIVNFSDIKVLERYAELSV